MTDTDLLTAETISIAETLRDETLRLPLERGAELDAKELNRLVPLSHSIAIDFNYIITVLKEGPNPFLLDSAISAEVRLNAFWFSMPKTWLERFTSNGQMPRRTRQTFVQLRRNLEAMEAAEMRN